MAQPADLSCSCCACFISYRTAQSSRVYRTESVSVMGRHMTGVWPLPVPQCSVEQSTVSVTTNSFSDNCEHLCSESVSVMGRHTWQEFDCYQFHCAVWNNLPSQLPQTVPVTTVNISVLSQCQWWVVTHDRSLTATNSTVQCGTIYHLSYHRQFNWQLWTSLLIKTHRDCLLNYTLEILLLTYLLTYWWSCDRLW